MDKTNQLDIFEEKIAAKATILMQKDSVEIRLNPKIIVTSHAAKCPYSFEEMWSAEEGLCERCPNKDLCGDNLEEVDVWPLPHSNISKHIELLNEAYAYLSSAIAEININSVQDDIVVNALENYQNDFAFLSALLNVLSSDRGRSLKYSKYREILSDISRWLPHDEKVDSQMLSPLESYVLHVNKSMAIWNDAAQYEQYIDWVIKRKDSFAAYTCENLIGLCFSILDYYVSQNINIKRCKICGKFFSPQLDYREAYCSKECARKFENIRVSYRRQSECYKEYEKTRNMLRKRREQSCSFQTENEIFAAEHEAEELWKKLKTDMVAGRITEDAATEILADFRNNLKKVKK